MKYNEKANRHAPRLNGATLTTPRGVVMVPCDDGMWVHYVEYCEAIWKQKYKRCVTMAEWCETNVYNIRQKTIMRYGRPRRMATR